MTDIENNNWEVLSLDEIVWPTITLEFEHDEHRDAFYCWLEKHAIGMFADYTDDSDLDVVFRDETYSVLVTSGETIREWKVADEAYQEKVESEEINE